ncbi:Multiple C2 and transmembrane domain-containing protein 1 [Durusdinium trenchii]|uniref:Multiple C2 and transmembrane domain-containing protein 1 n=1 Tax=Durusdinium trenchii TaxID=1381693 RepID=A0ABP0RJQ2_9DINO
MLEGLVNRLVTQYLSDYFSYGELKVAGLGNVTVLDLELKPSVIPANLAVRIKECSIHKINVNVSPLNLLSWNATYAVSVELDTVSVVLAERRAEDWDERAELEALKAAKLAVVQALRDAAFASVETKVASMEGSLAPEDAATESSLMSMVMSMVARVADNLKVSVKEISISYLFEGVERDGAISVSVRDFVLDNTEVSPSFEGFEVQGSADGDIAVGGLVVEPVQGPTSRIVRKQILVQGISVAVQTNVSGRPSSRVDIVRPFDMEAVTAANLASDPRPTQALVDLRVDEICVEASAEDLATLTFVGESLSKQAKWQAWCQKRFEAMVEVGLSSAEQMACFHLYERMCEAGSEQIKDPKAALPTVGDVSTKLKSGVDGLLEDLSWLQRCEMRAHPDTVSALLTGAANLVARRERAKVKAALERNKAPGITGRIRGAASSWLSWAVGQDGKDGKENQEDVAKSAQELSLALGIGDQLAEDPNKRKVHYRRVFDAIDKDGSGDIDVVELQVGLAMAGTTLSASKVEALIEKFDTDKNGTIDFDEFCAMCELAPQQMLGLEPSGGQEDHARFAVVGVSMMISGFSLALRTSPKWKTPDSELVLASFDRMRTVLAVENVTNPVIGRKSVDFALDNLQVGLSDTTARRKLETPVLTTSPFSGALAEVEGLVSFGEDEGVLARRPSSEASKETARSKIKVSVMSVALQTTEVANNLHPYCALFELDEFKEAVSLQTTPLVFDAPEPRDDRLMHYDLAELSMSSPLEFSGIHAVEPGSVRVQIQVRQREVKTSWFRRMTKSRKVPAEPDVDDLLLTVADVDVPLRGVNPDMSPARMRQATEVVEEWHELQGGFGKVLVRTEVSLVSVNRDAAKSSGGGTERSKVHCEVVATSNIGNADVAVGVQLPRFFVDMDPDVHAHITQISSDLNKALEDTQWHMIADDGASAAWRCRKVLVDLSFVGFDGIDSAKVSPTCEVSVGGESLRGATLDDKFSIGEVQNLEQLLSNDRHAQVRVSFGKSLRLAGLELQHIVEAALTGKASLVLDCDTSMEGVQARVAVDLDVIGAVDSQAASDGNGVDNVEESEEHQATWQDWEPADPFGLTMFRPLVEENIANLHVQVIQAKGLMAADYGGTSDPYCSLGCHGQQSKTHVVPKTLNPIWGDREETSTFTFGPLPGTALAPNSPETLDVEVFDKDFGGEWTDDFLGLCHIPLKEIYEEVTAANDANKRSGRNVLSKRHSSFSPLLAGGISADREVTKWFDLLNKDGSSVAQGAVQLRCWLEPVREPRRPVSVLPVSLDVTVMVAASMPFVRIPEKHEMNTSGRPIDVDLGKPNFVLQLNQGASTALVSRLALHKRLTALVRDATQDLNLFGGRGNAENEHDQRSDLVSNASESSDHEAADTDSGFFSVQGKSSSSGRAAQPGDMDVDDDELDEFQSLANTNSEAGEDDHEEDGDFGEQGDTPLIDRAKRMTSAASLGKSRSQTKVSFLMHVDEWLMEFSFLSRRTLGRRAFMRLSLRDVENRLVFAVAGNGLPIFRCVFELGKFGLEDCSQRHEVIGHSLEHGVYAEMANQEEPREASTEHVEKKPQLRCSLVYDSARQKGPKHRDLGACHELLVGAQVNGMFLLVSPLLDFAIRLLKAFGMLEPVETADSPVSATASVDGELSPSLVSLQPQGGAAEEEKQEAEGGDEAVGPAFFLPVSRVRVVMSLREIELHLMSRAKLCIDKQRRVLRYPPKSLVIKTDTKVSYEGEPDGTTVGLAHMEQVQVKTVCQAAIVRLRLRRELFQEFPNDFLSGDNVILEPFTSKITIRVNPLESARKLQLDAKAETFSQRTSSGMESFFGRYDEEDDDQEDDQEEEATQRPVEEKEEDRRQHAAGTTSLKQEDIWGVDQYIAEAHRVMHKRQAQAQVDRLEVVRMVDVRVEGLEARMDTADQVFLYKVSAMQTALLDAMEPPTQGKKATMPGDEEPVSGHRDSLGSMMARERDESAWTVEETEVEQQIRFISARKSRKLVHKRRSLCRLPDFAKDEAEASKKLEQEQEQMQAESKQERSGMVRRSLDRVSKVSTSIPSMMQRSKGKRSVDESQGQSDFEAADEEEELAREEAEVGEDDVTVPSWILPINVPMLVFCTKVQHFRRVLPGDLAGSWNVARDTECLEKLTAHAGELMANQGTFDQVSISVDQLLVGFGNNKDGYPVPFLRFVLAKFSMNCCSQSVFAKDLTVRGYAAMTCSLFNQLSKAWEPVLEPWTLLIIADQAPAEQGMLAQGIAPRRLNINVTDALLEGLNDFLACLDPSFSPMDDERLHGSYTPNWVVNETGHTAQVWPVKDPQEQMKTSEPQLLTYKGQQQMFEIENGQAQTVHLHDTSMLRHKMMSLLSQMRSTRRRLVLRTITLLRSSKPIEERRKELEVFEDEEEVNPEQLRKDLTDLFGFLDEDGSGEISPLELHSALSRCGEPISLEEVVYAIGEMDSEGVENVDAANTTISLEEFLVFFQMRDDDHQATEEDHQAAGLEVRSFGFRFESLPSESTMTDDEEDDGRREPQQLRQQILIAPCATQGLFMLQASRTLGGTFAPSSLELLEVVEDQDQLFEPALSHEEELELLENEKRQMMASFVKLRVRDRMYQYKDLNADCLSIVANSTKMGRSSAANVLFLETPIRLENRTIVPLEFFFVCRDPARNTVFEEEIFCLAPGEEQSIPVKYLYGSVFFADQPGPFGFAVRPVLDSTAKARLRRNKSGRVETSKARLQSHDFSAGSGNSLPSAKSLAKRRSEHRDWARSDMVVSFDGGQGLSVLLPFREEDDILDDDGKLLNTALYNNKAFEANSVTTSELVGVNRLGFPAPQRRTEGEGQDHEQAGAISSFECVMLTQRNAVRRFETKEILTVQVLQGSRLMAADDNGTSDPFVVVTTLNARNKVVEKFTTPTVHNTLDPVWPNKATFRFGEGRAALNLQRKLRFSVVDHDSLSSNDPLGYVNLEMETVLGWFQSGAQHKHGVRGNGKVLQKSFALEGGKGVSQKEVRGSLTVEFAYDKYSTATEVPARFAQHVFSFYPPFMLQNLLPFDVEVLLVEEVRNTGTRVSEHVIKLPRGACVPFHEIDGALLEYLNPAWQRHRASLRKKRGLKEEPDYGDDEMWEASMDESMVSMHAAFVEVRASDRAARRFSKWSGRIRRSGSAVALLEEGEDDQDPGWLGSISVEVERKALRDGGGRRLVLQSPLWVVNKTHSLLEYRATVDKTTAKERMKKGKGVPDDWIRSHEPHDSSRGIVCVHLEADGGRLQLQRQEGSGADKVSFQSNPDLLLLDEEDDDLKAGLPVYVSLRAPSVAFEQAKPCKLLVECLDLEGGTPKEGCGLLVGVRVGQERRLSAALTGRALPLTWPCGTGLVALTVMEPTRSVEAQELLVELLSANESTKEVEELSRATVGLLKDLVTRDQEEGLAVTLGDFRLRLVLRLAEVECDQNLVSIHGQKIAERAATLSGVSVPWKLYPFQREVGLYMEPLFGDYGRTAMLTVGPRFVLCNLSKERLLVKQEGAPDETAVFLAAAKPTAATAAATVEGNMASQVRKVAFDFAVRPGWKGTHNGTGNVHTFGRRVQVRLAEQGSAWCEPFPIDDIDDFGLQLRDAQGERRSRVWVDANAVVPSQFFVFRPLPISQTTYVVQNHTSSVFAVAQVPAVKVGFWQDVKSLVKRPKSPEKLARALPFELDQVPPDHELPLPLDFHPVEGLRVHVLIVPMKASVDGQLVPDFAHGFRIRFKDGLKERVRVADGEDLSVVVKTEGTRLCVRLLRKVTAPKKTVLGNQPKSMSKLQRRLQRKKMDAARLRAYFRSLQPQVPSMEVLVHLSSACVSLFSSAKRLEIAYVALQRVHMEMAMETMTRAGAEVSRTTMELCVAHLQIDSSQINARYPVMLASSPATPRSSSACCGPPPGEDWDRDVPVLSSVSQEAKGKTKLLSDRFRRMRSVKSYIRMQFVYDTSDESSFDVFRYFALQMRPVEVKLDGAFLAGMFLVLDPLLNSSRNTGSIEGEGAVPGLHEAQDSYALVAPLVEAQVAAVEVPAQDTMYFDSIRIEPTSFVITVNIGSDRDLRDTLKQYGISALYLRLFQRISRLEDFSLDLTKGYYEAVTSHKFTYRYTSLIVRDVLRQIHEVIFNFTKRLSKLTGLSRRSQINKIRQPLVPVGGALVTYGPGPRPAIVENKRERDAALVIERFFLRSLDQVRGVVDRQRAGAR